MSFLWKSMSENPEKMVLTLGFRLFRPKMGKKWSKICHFFELLEFWHFFRKSVFMEMKRIFFSFRKCIDLLLKVDLKRDFSKKDKITPKKPFFGLFAQNSTFSQFNFFLFCREFHADSKYTKIIKKLWKIRKISQKNTFLHKKATISSNLHRKSLDS